MKYLSINHAAVLLLITAGTSFAQSKSEQPGVLMYYGTHLATNFVVTCGSGFGCGIAFSMADELINSVDKASLCRASTATFIKLAALTGVVYAFYKTPQWTDTYLLDIERERTLKENMISFFGRLFPLGIIITEYIQRTADDASSV